MNHMRIALSKGQTTIEFALILLLLLTLIFWIIDLGLMFFVQFTMQNAVREGARFAVVGQGHSSSSRALVVQRIRDKSFGLYDKYCPYPGSTTFSYLVGTSTLVPLPTDPSDPASLTVGNPDQIIIISVTCNWPVLTPMTTMMKATFPNGIFNFTVKSTMKNEPF